jgi:quinol monooxygenase YgiN
LRQATWHPLAMKNTTYTPADFNDGFVVAIIIEAKPGEEGRVATILDVMVAPTMAESGVKLFLPYRSPTDPALFFVFELYVDAAAWDAHQATEHFKDAVRDLLPRVVRRERVPFRPFTPLNTSA